MELHTATMEQPKGTATAPAVPAPGLAPVTPQELVAVLEKLDRVLERKPQVLLDPTVLFMLRLAVMAKDYMGAEPLVDTAALEEAQDTIQDLEERLERSQFSVQEIEFTASSLKDDLDRAKDDLADAQRRLQEAEARQHSPQLEEEVNTLTSYLMSVAQALNLPEGASYEQVVTQAGAIQERLADSTRAHDNTRIQTKNLEKRVRSLEQSRDSLRKERDTSKGELNRVHEVVAEFEYGALSNRFTFKQTNKPIPCCPSCGGLDPEEVENTQHAGHRKKCWMQRLVKEVGTDG